jgi:hypothetical protein
MSPVMPTRLAVTLPARARGPRRAEGGLVLFIALIVLVAMTLAGIALMRSVDTALVVAGNMAFKQSAVSVADRGTQEAAAWLVANSAGQTLHSDNPSAGYSASIVPGLPEPDWFDMNSWANSFVVNGGTPDAAGNVVRYQIHRLCNAVGPPGGGCALYFGTSTAATGGSMAVGSPVFLGTPQYYYRVTTRVDGPRDTVSVIQSSLLVSVGAT